MRSPAPPPARPRVAIYARCSGDKQAEKDLSIPAQLDACRAHATHQGWDIVEEYVEPAETARHDDRPQFQAMLDAVRSKPRPFEFILVWKFSRFARSREVSVLYKRQIERNGARVVSLNEPADDSPQGRMYEGIVEVFDEFYSANLAQDIARGMRKNASMGFRNGGKPPVGYRTERTGPSEGCPRMKLVPDPAWAPLVQRMFRMVLDGAGVTQIAGTLGTEGIRTRRGHEWAKTTVLAVLKNEVYAGTTLYGSTKMRGLVRTEQEPTRIEATHEPLVCRTDFDRVQALLRKRAPQIRSTSVRRGNYLLSGVLVCAVCGSTMIGHAVKGGAHHYYGCQRKLKQGAAACPGRLINRDSADRAVLDALRTHFTRLHVIAAISTRLSATRAASRQASLAEQGARTAQAADIRRRRARLIELLESGQPGADALLARIAELTASIDAVSVAPDAPAAQGTTELDFVHIERAVASTLEAAKHDLVRAWIAFAQGAGEQLTLTIRGPVSSGENAAR